MNKTKNALLLFSFFLAFFAVSAFADSPLIFGPSQTSKNLQPNLRLENHLVLANPNVGISFGIPFDLESEAETAWTMKFPPNAGTAGKVLRTDGTGVTTWATAVGIGNSVTGATDKAVLFTNGSSNLAQSSNFLWDYTNNKMSVIGTIGVGTTTPLGQLHLSGTTTSYDAGFMYASRINSTIQSPLDGYYIYGSIVEPTFDNNGHAPGPHIGQLINVNADVALKLLNASSSGTSVGVQVYQTAGEGIEINQTAGKGLRVNQTAGTALDVNQTAGTGLKISGTTDNGIEIQPASGPAMFANGDVGIGVFPVGRLDVGGTAKTPAGGYMYAMGVSSVVQPQADGLYLYGVVIGPTFDNNGHTVSSKVGAIINVTADISLRALNSSSSGTSVGIQIDQNAGTGLVVNQTAGTAITSNGKVVINDTGGAGGNVPHACHTIVGAAGTYSQSCPAGQIAMGGGVDCGSTALFVSQNTSTGGDPATGWSGSCTSLLNVVTNTTILVNAICCAY